jgi:hypothetical protein
VQTVGIFGNIQRISWLTQDKSGHKLARAYLHIETILDIGAGLGDGANPQQSKNG